MLFMVRCVFIILIIAQKLNSKSTFIVNPILRHLGINADVMWSWLLQAHPNPKLETVIEVGVYDGIYTCQAAKFGFNVLSYEPSPKSYNRIMDNIQKLNSTIQASIHLFQKAVSNTSSGTIKFHSTGSTEDHLGVLNPNEAHRFLNVTPIEVNITTIDKEVAQHLDINSDIYLIKVDTQGHDGYVLDGMREVMVSGRVKNIIFELWPNAMKHAGFSCFKSLNLLHTYGYRLYELRMYAWGGRLPVTRESLFNHSYYPDELCAYIEQIKGFGMWTDIFATRDPLLGGPVLLEVN